MENNTYDDTQICKMYHSNDLTQQKKAIEVAITKYEKYIYFIMTRYFPTYAEKYKDDLFQCGVEGLIKSMKHYDASYSLSTYSKNYIIHEMKNFEYFLLNIPSAYYAKLQRDIRDTMTQLYTMGIKITDTIIAKITGIPLKIVSREKYLIEINDMGPELLETSPCNIPSNENIEEEITDMITAKEIMNQIEKLPDIQKEILTLKFIDDYSFRTISSIKELDLSEVYSEYKKGIKKIKNKMKY